MKAIKLKALVRDNTGKGAARKMRADGHVPGVAYGEGIDPILLSVSDYDFTKLITGVASKSMLIDLDIEGYATKKVVVKEIQMDPVVKKIISVDFKVISMDKEIDVLIPLILTGTPIGVKNDGGILQTIRRDVRIACLPDRIPENITYDVSEMGIGDALHFEDLKPEGYKILSNPKVSICTVVAPTVIKEKKAAGEGEEGEGVEGAGESTKGDSKEPEVIKEKKDE